MNVHTRKSGRHTKRGQILFYYSPNIFSVTFKRFFSQKTFKTRISIAVKQISSALPSHSNPSLVGEGRIRILPGQVFDSESGLFQNHHREYQALGGNYLTTDPIGLDGGSMSLYNYVNGQPTRLTDPTGLFPVQACVLVATSVYFVYKYYKLQKCVKQCSVCPSNPSGDPKIICPPAKADEGNTGPTYSCRTYCTLEVFAGVRGKTDIGSNRYP